MGTINTNIRIDELITEIGQMLELIEQMEEKLEDVSPLIVSINGESGTLASDVWQNICNGVKNGAPVTIKASIDDVSVGKYLGFYAELTEGEEYDTVIFGKQGNDYSLSIVDGEWNLMEM